MKAHKCLLSTYGEGITLVILILKPSRFLSSPSTKHQWSLDFCHTDDL